MSGAPHVGNGDALGRLLGGHPRMEALRAAIRRAAPLDAPVLVCGPTGAGKELVARALHSLSRVAAGPFCPVNVAALPEGLVESELFGSARGAFTGAVADRPGLIDAAAGGTLFLDEAGDLARAVQAKLLRAIEYGEVRRIGATATTVRCVRLIAAAQEEPAHLVRAGQWREDFCYRLAGVVLRVPALAEHASDIPVLASTYLQARGLPPLAHEALALLARQPWPGNVRELEQTLIRAAFHSPNGCITLDAVQAALADGGNGHHPSDASLGAARSRHVRETVAACGGDTQAAAAALGISRSQVYRLLRDLSLPAGSADSHSCEWRSHPCESPDPADVDAFR